MSKRIAWVLAVAVVAAEAALFAGNVQDKPKKLNVDDVVQLWLHGIKSTAEFATTGGSPEKSPNVAAYSFRLTGPTFEECWNHYAKLCGIDGRYAEKSFLIAASDNPKGSYVVSDRMASDKGGRELSVFMLRTDAYTATVTFKPGTDGKSITGSLSVVIP